MINKAYKVRSLAFAIVMDASVSPILDMGGTCAKQPSLAISGFIQA